MSKKPWDDLGRKPRELERQKAETAAAAAADPLQIEEKEENPWEILTNRFLFGAIAGAATGASFGLINAARQSSARSLMVDPMNSVGMQVARHSGIFSGYFASYHVGKRGLELFAPKPLAENSVLVASVVCMSPFVALSSIRPLMPYAILLIGLDVLNGIDS